MKTNELPTDTPIRIDDSLGACKNGILYREGLVLGPIAYLRAMMGEPIGILDVRSFEIDLKKPIEFELFR